MFKVNKKDIIDVIDYIDTLILDYRFLQILQINKFYKYLPNFFKMYVQNLKYNIKGGYIWV